MSQSSSSRPFTGRHIAMMFMGFFGIVFAVNTVMAVLAYRSWTGLVVENSYIASQQFNADVAALKKFEALGISHQLHYADGRLFLTLIGADGKPMDTDKVQISIGRPVDDGEDLKLVATHSANGQFETTAKLGIGVWTGELSALVGGSQLWRQPFKLTVGGQ